MYHHRANSCTPWITYNVTHVESELSDRRLGVRNTVESEVGLPGVGFLSPASNFAIQGRHYWII